MLFLYSVNRGQYKQIEETVDSSDNNAFWFKSNGWKYISRMNKQKALLMCDVHRGMKVSP